MDIPSLSIRDLHVQYRSGGLTPNDMVDELRTRISNYTEFNIWITLLDNSDLSGYISRLTAEKVDDLPLYGVPFAIKDNIDLAGIPTTAACPAFTYVPDRSAFVVQRLIDAGAIPLGKTNMDQFATGLVGTRSPYGATKNSISPEYISGGSSSGSAVATALGLVSFSLGTDTAGSGRVPAAFNELIGVKPSRGIVSMSGVVPACRSLDTVSLFTTSLSDAEMISRIMFVPDKADPYHRRYRPINSFGAKFKFGIPGQGLLEFFGNSEYQRLYEQAVSRLQQSGGEAVEIDFTPFRDAARLLYEGPWVAERYLATRSIVDKQPDSLLAITRRIIEKGKEYTATDTFSASYQLQMLKQKADLELDKVDFLVTPTAGTIYRIDEVARQPAELNSNLGYYTNFMNLLDYCAIAIPAGRTDAGLPFGITLFSNSMHDHELMSYAGKFLKEEYDDPASLVKTAYTEGTIKLVVCGAHMTGMPLNGQLLELGCSFIARTKTAANYRLYDLADGTNRPGLIRDDHTGAAIEVEIWSIPEQKFGRFLRSVSAPLGIGSVELIDNSVEKGFICESYIRDNALDITEYGGWRAYIQNK